ncbi:glycosyl hydrolase [Paenibacillus sp. T1]|uniref:Glycosyl hydrolase n=2 Tax=Paenibacillus glycinis TaxID=2697035 RepID=A0ABW9XS31_9BACL|nr:glycosyl hydrolase [Paenibacillus glycinis]
MMHSRPDAWGDHAWTDWAMNIDRWDWNSGVGIIAAADYAKTGRGTAIIREVEAWMTRNIRQSGAAMVINAVAPFAVFPALHEETGESYYAEKSRQIADWLIGQAPRTRSGAFEHTVTENASFAEQIWADTVFMAVLFLARTAGMTGDRQMADESIRQLLLHLQALQDEETGLLYHAWNCGTNDWMSAAKWNRANAWNAVGVPMILEAAAAADHDAGPLGEIKERYHRLAEALVARQGPGGLWQTVLDRPSYYEETSGSAGIACGLYKAARAGLVPRALIGSAERAVPAVLRQIRENGAVAGVSGGTPVLASIEAYDAVPIFPTLYGQGLTLMLLAEALKA